MAESDDTKGIFLGNLLGQLLSSGLNMEDFTIENIAEVFAAKAKASVSEAKAPMMPPPEDPELDHNLPQGKGLTFVALTALRKSKEQDDEEEAESTADWLLKNDFTWVKLLLESRSPQAYTTFPDKLPIYATTLRSRGVDTWGWGWPLEGQHIWFVDEMLREIDRTGVRGVVVNTETQYSWRGRPKEEKRIRKECEYVFRSLHDHGVPVAPSTYGDIKGFGRYMPIEEMVEYSDFVQIQLYTSRDPALRVRQARELGFKKVIAVLGTQAAKKTGAMKKAFDGTMIPKKGNSAASMQWRLENTPHDGALNWWQATSLKYRGADFLQAIRDMELEEDLAA